MSPAERPPARSARAKARKRALDLLFESEQRGVAPAVTLGDRIAHGDAPSNPYTETLVIGVAEHQPALDALISRHATDWPLERMPAVDRVLLRIAAYEIHYVDEVPTAVAIDQAVSFARELSTDESPAFVNGVLAAIARDDPPTVEPAVGDDSVIAEPAPSLPGTERTPDG